MDKLIEKMARTPVETHKYNGERYLTLDNVVQIMEELKKAGYVKLSSNQDIPDNPYELYSYGARIQHQEEESKGFKCCAEQMLKDNFRRI